tara:strand:- start:340 stop:750 length:411 start_codon:yes stop_codon:yes gene_type:complete
MGALVYQSFNKLERTRPKIQKRIVINPRRPNRVPININTQHVADPTNLGVLYNNGNRLNLFGNRVHNGSDKWNYFTRSNDNVSVQLPVMNKGKDCTDEYGCPEIYENDRVSVVGYQGQFKVDLNNARKPKYLYNVF